MVDISALFGSTYAFGDVLKARAQIPGAVAKKQTVDSVKGAIADATRLDSSGRKTLNNLTDSVNQFAQGNDKLLRDIVGISNLMQFGGKEQNVSGDSPYAKLLSAYYAGKTGSVVDLVS